MEEMQAQKQKEEQEARQHQQQQLAAQMEEIRQQQQQQLQQQMEEMRMSMSQQGRMSLSSTIMTGDSSTAVPSTLRPLDDDQTSVGVGPGDSISMVGQQPACVDNDALMQLESKRRLPNR